MPLYQLSGAHRRCSAAWPVGAWWMWSTTANWRGSGAKSGRRRRAGRSALQPRPRRSPVPQVVVSGQRCRGVAGGRLANVLRRRTAAASAPPSRGRGRCRGGAGGRGGPRYRRCPVPQVVVSDPRCRGGRGGGSPPYGPYRAAAPQPRRRRRAIGQPRKQRRRCRPAGGGCVGAAAGGPLATES